MKPPTILPPGELPALIKASGIALHQHPDFIRLVRQGREFARLRREDAQCWGLIDSLIWQELEARPPPGMVVQMPEALPRFVEVEDGRFVARAGGHTPKSGN